MLNFAHRQPGRERRSFALGIILISAAVMLITVLVLREMYRTSEATRSMYARSIRGVALAGELQFHAQEARRHMLYVLTTTDPSEQIVYADKSRASDEQGARLIAEYALFAQSEKELELVRHLQADWPTYLKSRDEVLALILEGTSQEAVARDLHEGIPLFNHLRDDLQQVTQIANAQANQQMAEGAVAGQRSFLKIILILGVTLALATIAILSLQRRMIRAVQKKTDQLEESYAFAQAIISSAGEGIIVYDRDLKIVVWNPVMEEMTGLTAAQAVGQHLPNLTALPWLIAHGGDDLLRRALAGATVPVPDIEVHQPNGHTAWRSVLYTPQRNAKQEVVGVIGLVSDVTSRHQTEAALRDLADRLKQSNRELEEFAFIASHDLQEPLRKIQAFGDRLKNKYDAALGETGRDYLERMQNAAARMQVLIHDLLSFSRVTTKAKPFEPVALEQVVQDVVSDLEIRLEQSQGKVEFDELPIIDADPTQIRQLLQNLIGNALKFHQPDVAPHIQVRATLVKGKANACELTIADNGIGFDEKYLDRIFTIFQRLHGRSEYEGSGIGLAVCRKIVERHGGSITARSQPQQGATFIITLPVRQSQSAAFG